jgi:virulence factor
MTLIKKADNKPIRVAVIGAGKMGQNHLRIYSMLKDVDLVAVVDLDKERVEHAATQYNCLAFTALEDVIGKVDAVTIAVPSSQHAEVGVFFLKNDIHCLIEKPLAVNDAECIELIETAEQRGVILLVGHIEHFNPAVQQLNRILADGQHMIQAVHVQRMSGNTQRITDVDVVMDMMIHDLEIVNSLVNQPLIDLSALAVGQGKETGLDYVSALLSFSSGTIANITASRITQNKVRKLAITSDIGYITLDYSAQELLIYRQAHESALVNSEGCVIDQAVERVLVRPTEPLIAEIQNFIHSVRVGVPLGVDGRKAHEALKIAWKIQDFVVKQSIVQHKKKLVAVH